MNKNAIKIKNYYEIEHVDKIELNFEKSKFDNSHQKEGLNLNEIKKDKNDKICDKNYIEEMEKERLRFEEIKKKYEKNKDEIEKKHQQKLEQIKEKKIKF